MTRCVVLDSSGCHSKACGGPECAEGECANDARPRDKAFTDALRWQMDYAAKPADMLRDRRRQLAAHVIAYEKALAEGRAIRETAAEGTARATALIESALEGLA